MISIFGDRCQRRNDFAIFVDMLSEQLGLCCRFSSIYIFRMGHFK